MDKEKTSPLRAVIVTRVSTDKQEEGTSLGAQLVACQKCATDLGATVVGYYEEIVSGALYQARLNMQQALQDIEAERANCLIVAKLDRAGRDVDALRDIKRRVERAGGRLIFADGLSFQQGAVGNLMFTQLAGFAEFEREMIRERTMRGSHARARQGIMPVRALRPYGYRFVQEADVIAGTHTKEQIGSYVLVPEEAKWIKEMFEQYANGASLRSIIRFLQAHDVPRMRGGLFWRTSTLYQMLRHPIYKGKAAYSKNKRVIDEARIERGLRHLQMVKRDESEWIYLDAPAIVSAEVWDAVQERLEKARAQRAGNPGKRRLLAGIIRCQKCGTAMRFRNTVHHKFHGKELPKPDRRAYYQCATNNNVGIPGAPHCGVTSYIAEVMEGLTIKALLHVCAQPAVLKAAIKAYRNSQDKGADNSKQIARLEAELRKIEAKEMRTAESQIEAKTEGRDDAVYRSLLHKLSEQRKGILAQLELLQGQEIQTPIKLSDADIVSSSIEGIRVVITAPDEVVTLAEKNLALMSVVKTVVPITRKSVQVRLHSPSPGLDFVCKVSDSEIEVSLETAQKTPRRVLPKEPPA